MSSPSIVLDASALLAFLQLELGHDRVRTVLDNGAVISPVNLAEVYTKMLANGRPISPVVDRLQTLGLDVITFTEADACLAARLVLETRPFGLSLGDRACLAAGKRLNLPVLTADHAWLRLQIGVAIQTLRP